MTEHGKWHKYNRGCRCEPCKAAALEYRRAWRERKRSLMLAGDPSVPHGTTRGYGDWSCRCDRCCAASDAYNEARRRAKGIEPKRVASDEELSEAVHLARLHGTKVAAERTGWNASTIYQWSRRLGIEPLHREAQHGSRTMYGHYGCRCDPCREAQNTYMKERRLKGIVPAGATHGKASTYANYGCRCDACLAAGSDANRRGRESRLRRAKADPSVVPHGTHSGYNAWGCRCDRCCAAYQQRAAS